MKVLPVPPGSIVLIYAGEFGDDPADDEHLVKEIAEAAGHTDFVVITTDDPSLDVRVLDEYAMGRLGWVHTTSDSA